MKTKIIFVALFYVSGWQLLYAEAVSVIVPKQYLVEKASLVLYMLDALGNQCIGTCRLNEAFEQRNILQQELCIQRQDAVGQLSDSIEITNSSQPRDNDVVLHIEFDNDVRVLRILIVKDNLLADDPFDVVSISLMDQDSDDSFDMLTNLIDGIDSSAAATPCEKQVTSFNQYALYAKIYCMMQYKHAKRKVKNLTAWLCKRR